MAPPPMLDKTVEEPKAPLSSLAGGYQLSVKNEDRYQILEATIGGEQICFMLLADGHGGKKTVDLASSTLRTIASTATGPSKMELHVAALAAFKALHEEATASCTTSGCSLTVCSINTTRQELNVWNVGDSLPLLITERSHALLGTNHRLCANEEEVARVIASGGHVQRATNEDGTERGPLRAWPGGMLISRAIGDADCSFLSSEPAHETHTLARGGGAVVIGSNGVWDRLAPGKVARLVQKGKLQSPRGAASLIVRKASKPRPTADTTAVIMLFGPFGQRALAEEPRPAAAKGTPASAPAESLDANLPFGEDLQADAWTVNDVDVLMSDMRDGTARDRTSRVLHEDSRARAPLSAAARVLRSWRLLGDIKTPKRAQRKSGVAFVGVSNTISNTRGATAQRRTASAVHGEDGDEDEGEGGGTRRNKSRATASREVPEPSLADSAKSSPVVGAPYQPPRRHFSIPHCTVISDFSRTSSSGALLRLPDSLAAVAIPMVTGVMESDEPLTLPPASAARSSRLASPPMTAPFPEAHIVPANRAALLDKVVAALRRGTQAPAHSWLALGCDISARDSQGNTLLHSAAACSTLDLLGALLRKGASISAVGSNGQTPLHAAAVHGQHKAAHLLLLAGANVDATDDDGATPLILCAARGRTACCGVLLGYGANVTAVDASGRTAAVFAQTQRHRDILVLLKRHQQALLKKKAGLSDSRQPYKAPFKEPVKPDV